VSEQLEQTAALNAALAKAQADFPAITRSKTVSVRTRSGDQFSYSYAPLEEILDKCRPVLAAHGLALVQLLEDVGRGPALRTELRHAEGAIIGSSFPLAREPENPQALGSLLTYLRRYAIVALLGIAPEEDDDGAGVGASSEARAWTETQRKEIFRVLQELADEFAPPEDDEDWVATARRTARRLWHVDGLSKLSYEQADDLLKLIRKRQRDLRDQAAAQQEHDAGGFQVPEGVADQLPEESP